MRPPSTEGNLSPMAPGAAPAPATCCPNPVLRWRQVAVADRWSDVYACVACAHVHAMESWPVALTFPTERSCPNCGGQLHMNRCVGRCGLSSERVKELHRGLAGLHPSLDFLQAAVGAFEAGRQVLALKLATAAAVWGSADFVLARTLRLQALDSMGLTDRALDEAYGWARAGAPTVIWALVAELESAAGNVNGAIAAVRHGLDTEPLNLPLWSELAELLVHTDSRGPALQAARRGLPDPVCQATCLQVIADVAERYYEENQPQDALASMQHAQQHDQDHVALAWLRARIVEGEGKSEDALVWATRVLELKPDHGEARAMVKRPRPRRWLW